MLKSLALGAALVLCAFTTPSFASGFDLSKLEMATVNDLEAAQADATAHGDTIAYTCYVGVEAFVKANPLSAPTINVVGVASAFQTARDGVKLAETATSSGLIPQALEIACGPLALDVQNDLGHAAVGGVSIFGLHL